MHRLVTVYERDQPTNDQPTTPRYDLSHNTVLTCKAILIKFCILLTSNFVFFIVPTVSRVFIMYFIAFFLIFRAVVSV